MKTVTEVLDRADGGSSHHSVRSERNENLAQEAPSAMSIDCKARSLAIALATATGILLWCGYRTGNSLHYGLATITSVLTMSCFGAWLSIVARASRSPLARFLNTVRAYLANEPLPCEQSQSERTTEIEKLPSIRGKCANQVSDQ